MVGTTARAGLFALSHLLTSPVRLTDDNRARPFALIVDDDEGIRSAPTDLLLSVGSGSSCFDSTQERLNADLPERPNGLILDVRVAGPSTSPR